MTTFPNVKAGSQSERILRVLADRQWHTTAGIHRKAGTSRLNSRISELRSRGYRIEHERRNGPTETRSHAYRWLDAPGVPLTVPPEFVAPKIPRTPATRYRIYTLCDGEPCCIAAAADPESLGVALVTMAREGQFEHSTVGIMDAPNDEQPGTWLAKPWGPNG